MKTTMKEASCYVQKMVKTFSYFLPGFNIIFLPAIYSAGYGSFKLIIMILSYKHYQGIITIIWAQHCDETQYCCMEESLRTNF